MGDIHNIVEDGVVAGNYYDKYASTNPLVKRMMNGFLQNIDQLIKMTRAGDIHEIGCGEGHLSCRVSRRGYQLRGSDFSNQVIAIARENAAAQSLDIAFEASSIYDLTPGKDAAELVMCCEVLEHLPDVPGALNMLHSLAKPFLIASVPREPIWRMLNMARGKYLGSLGNTPGHINHWSKNGFISLLRTRFEVMHVRSPLPWTMALCKAS